MKILILILILLLTDCTKEGRSEYYTYMINNTDHHISVKAFFEGNIEPYMSLQIPPHEKKQASYSGGPGSDGEGFSYGPLLGPRDSVLVIFNNTDTIAHYKPTLIGGAKKFYTYDTPRNLYNQKNYTRIIVKKTSNLMICHFFYTFTEQDYLDASQ